MYGRLLCKKCWSGFANRRQSAYVFDSILFWGAQFVAAFALVFAGSFFIADEGSLDGFIDGVTGLVWLLAVALFLIKDGLFDGRSPGKALLGLRVVHTETGRPATPVASLMRNLPLLIPVVPLIVGFRLRRGPRWGDGWAKTRVVWDRFADRAPFASEPSLTPVGASQ